MLADRAQSKTSSACSISPHPDGHWMLDGNPHTLRIVLQHTLLQSYKEYWGKMLVKRKAPVLRQQTDEECNSNHKHNSPCTYAPCKTPITLQEHNEPLPPSPSPSPSLHPTLPAAGRLRGRVLPSLDSDRSNIGPRMAKADRI